MGSYRFGAKGFVTDSLLEPLLNSLPDIIHSVDKKGNIIFTNKKASHLLGYTHEELLSMSVFDLYAPEIRTQVKKGFAQLQEKGKMTFRESLLVAKSGEIIPVEIRSFGVYNEKGEFIRTFSMLRDIREMKEMRDNLMHAERLGGIGQLASCVVHDIHNPLMVIQLYTEMLLQDSSRYMVPESSDEVEEYLHQMQKASEKIQKLLNHLRNFSRKQSEVKETAKVNDLIGDALFMVMNKIINQGIRVERENEDKDYSTYGARIQLEQVLMNIISNACDAMKASDEKSLKISISKEKLNQNNYIKCAITDSGCGIPQGSIDKVFSSFYTTKKMGEGTGIGLSICNDIIESHEGKIQVESEFGVGTTFIVLFPEVKKTGKSKK